MVSEVLQMFYVIQGVSLITLVANMYMKSKSVDYTHELIDTLKATRLAEIQKMDIVE